MAAISATLFDLIKTKINANMVACGNYGGPMAQHNPMYFMLMCQAIATGIAEKSAVIHYTSADTGMGGMPSVPGAGTGVGIKVDALWFDEHLYTELRQNGIDSFGSTAHDPYPPKKGNTGEYLHAISKGIADSVAEHYLTAYNLTSVHANVYLGSGLINNGGYSGLIPADIEGLIISSAPAMKGPFWPKIAKAVAKIYVEAIETNSTGKVVIAGICIPMMPPAGPPQVCGIPMAGVGIGTAV